MHSEPRHQQKWHTEQREILIAPKATTSDDGPKQMRMWDGGDRGLPKTKFVSVMGNVPFYDF